MLFWILTAIVTGLTLWWIIWLWYDQWAETFIGGVFTTIGQLVVGAFAWFALSSALLGIANGLADYEHSSDTKESLVALQTRDTVEGQLRGGIFASAGYVEGKRVISYTTKDDDGGIRVGYVDASETVIYEGDKKPELITHHYEKRNPLFFGDEVISTTETYSIHVPSGSVVESFEVSP